MKQSTFCRIFFYLATINSIVVLWIAPDGVVYTLVPLIIAGVFLIDARLDEMRNKYV